MVDEKSKNRYISTRYRPIWMKFGMMMYLRPLDPTSHKSLRILKIQDGIFSRPSNPFSAFLLGLPQIRLRLTTVRVSK